MNKRVNVIATFKEDGTIIPFRIRLIDEYGEYQVFDVKLLEKQENFPKIKLVKFKVSLVINGVNKIAKLVYHSDVYDWYLEM